MRTLFGKLFGSLFDKPSTEEERFDIPDAINAHVAWKARLEKCLSGTSEEKLDADVVRRDDCCKLGQWIHHAAQRTLHSDKDFVQLRDKHAQFHKQAGTIVRFAQLGRKEAAEHVFKNDYQHTSREVIKILVHMNQQVEAERN